MLLLRLKEFIENENNSDFLSKESEGTFFGNPVLFLQRFARIRMSH